MGNGKSRDETKFQTHVSLLRFGIRSSPQYHTLDDYWKQRIDYTMWQEFEAICNAMLPDDTDDRHNEYKKWECYSSIAILSIFLGVVAGLTMGISGGVTDNTALWVFGIILAGIGIIGGAVLALISDQTKTNIKSRFNRDSRENLINCLQVLNHKYRNVISFLVIGSGSFISIQVQVFVQHVTYIPDQRMLVSTLNTIFI